MNTVPESERQGWARCYPQHCTSQTTQPGIEKASSDIKQTKLNPATTIQCPFNHNFCFFLFFFFLICCCCCFGNSKRTYLLLGLLVGPSELQLAASVIIIISVGDLMVHSPSCLTILREIILHLCWVHSLSNQFLWLGIVVGAPVTSHVCPNHYVSSSLSASRLTSLSSILPATRLILSTNMVPLPLYLQKSFSQCGNLWVSISATCTVLTSQPHLSPH